MQNILFFIHSLFSIRTENLSFLFRETTNSYHRRFIQKTIENEINDILRIKRPLILTGIFDICVSLSSGFKKYIAF